MPYTKIFKKGAAFCFRNEETGKSRCYPTRQKAVKMLGMYHGFEHGWKPKGQKKAM